MSAAVPSFPVQEAAPEGRAPLTPRAEHRRGVRYGSSLACVVLGVYLVMQWSPSALMYSAPAALVLQTVAQLGLAIAVLLIGLALAPTSVARAAIAVVLAVGLLVIVTALFYLRLTGSFLLPVPVLWSVLIPGTAALGSGLLGWLIVRRRHPLTYVLVLGALLPGVVRHLLLMGGAESGVIWFSDLVTAFVVGVGGAWIAAGISHVLGGRRTSAPATSPPAAPPGTVPPPAHGTGPVPPLAHGTGPARGE